MVDEHVTIQALSNDVLIYIFLFFRPHWHPPLLLRHARIITDMGMAQACTRMQKMAKSHIRIPTPPGIGACHE